MIKKTNKMITDENTESQEDEEIIEDDTVFATR